MGPEAALGTITVRDAAGTALHDGTSASPYEPGKGGAVAVVFAPGPALGRWAGPGADSIAQVRTCEGGKCNAAGRCLSEPPTLTPKCNPRTTWTARRVPRTSTKTTRASSTATTPPGGTRTATGSFTAPSWAPTARVWVNDRLAVVSYDDLMPRVMRRVAEEVSACLRLYAARSENGGKLPWAAPMCRSRDPDPSLRWSDHSGDALRARSRHALPGDEPGQRSHDARALDGAVRSRRRERQYRRRRTDSPGGARGSAMSSIPWRRRTAPPRARRPRAIRSRVSSCRTRPVSLRPRATVSPCWSPVRRCSSIRGGSRAARRRTPTLASGSRASMRTCGASMPIRPHRSARRTLPIPRAPRSPSFNRVATLATRSRNDVVVTGD